VIGSRCLRQFLAALLAAVLLCAQLAVAAHACMGPVPASAALAGERMPDCDGQHHGGPEPVTPPLCKAHCDPGDPLPASGAAAVLADAAPVPVLLWLLATPPAPAGIEMPAFAPVNGPPRGAPPLYLSLLVLRN
jgi:hypothetical protein